MTVGWLAGGRASRVLVGSFAALMLGTIVVPAQSAGAAKPTANGSPGSLEICKSDAHGMAGKSFSFSVDGGGAFTVKGGACTGTMAVSAGSHTVVEAPTAGLEVAKIKANHTVSSNLASGTVVVKVKGGSTAANETLVTYFNQAVPALGLKVCKASDNPALVGDMFSFTENGGPAFSVQAGTVAAPVCGPVTKFPLNTVVNVAELATAGTHVSAISVSDGRGSNANLASGTVSATVGAGVTVVTYTNSLNPIPQAGYIEVCKQAGSDYVTGSFDFTITAPGFSATQPVLVGQCTAPIQVPAGQVSVSEAARFPFVTSAIGVVPAKRLVTQNISNQTATVTVPVGDSSTETMVTFTNVVLTGRVKICKTLAANATALAGSAFHFNVSAAVGVSNSDTVIAGAAGSTTCVFHPEALPLGSGVSITEQGTDNVVNTSVSVSPAGQDAGSTPPTAKLTVGTGVTTATFTNAAQGTVEVCKTAADPEALTQTFQFSVNGGAPISVHAGQCSLPIAVPAGTATISETAKNNFHFVGATAVGPTNDNRVVSGTNPVTVSVPFGGVANETLVTFTNAVNTGQFKICKVSSEPTLQNVTFNFLYAYTVNGTPVSGSAALTPGHCSSLSGTIPVVDPQGNPIPVSVTEQPDPNVVVSNIAVGNGTLVTSDLVAGTATVNVNQGITTVTYTNVRRPLGTIQVCKTAVDPSTALQTFQFSVNGGSNISVAAGTCSPSMLVLSGPATVQEVAKTNFHLVGVTAVGPTNDNRLTSGPTDNPATATVPPGTGSNTTQVVFNNAVDTSDFVLCKAANADLSGDQFKFSAQASTANAQVVHITLTPGNCTDEDILVPVVDPQGDPVTIDISEAATAGVDVADIEADNGTLVNSDKSAGTATVEVKAGTTKVTYTNALDPEIVICKDAADTYTDLVPFEFSVNGGADTEVDAGLCSDAITLTAGDTSATVKEEDAAGYHLTGITATGPSNDNRLTTGATDNPATVTVADGGASNVTTVTFTNAVDTGTLEVCKTSNNAGLDDTSFAFSVDDNVSTSTFSLKPTACWTDPNAVPLGRDFTVSETPTAGLNVAQISIDNSGDRGFFDYIDGVFHFTLNATGTTTVTLDNEANPCDSAVARASKRHARRATPQCV